MKLLPMVYVTDMTASIAFYQKLGFMLKTEGSRWSEVSLNGQDLALHLVDVAPEQHFHAGIVFVLEDETLESVRSLCMAHHIDIQEDITQQPFGRSLVIVDPDGMPIQINEYATQALN